jgi:zinc protease
MIVAPALDSGELERLRAESLDALEKQFPREDEEELGKFALTRRIFGAGHPYGHVPQGTVQSVRALDREKLDRLRQSLYTRSRLTIGLAGKVPLSLVARAKEAFGQLPPGKTSVADVPKPEAHKTPRLLLVKGPFEAVGYHSGLAVGFNRASDAYPRMYLAAMAWGKHRSFVGRLMSRAREIRGLNYGDYSYIENFPEGGHFEMEPTGAAQTRQAFTVWGRPTTLENGCFLARLLAYETDRFARDGLTAKEVELGQGHLAGYAPMLQMGLARELGRAIDDAFYGIPEGDSSVKRLVALARKKGIRPSVNALIKETVRPASLDYVVVTPDPEHFKAEILGPECGIKYAEGVAKPREFLDEDKIVSRRGLGVAPEDIEIIDSTKLFEE